MSKYDAVYFVGDNQVINRARVASSKTRNQGAFLGLLASLQNTKVAITQHYSYSSENLPSHRTSESR